MKKLLAVIGLLVTFSSAAFAGDVTPVKVSLFPKLAIPPAQTVHGLDLGLIATKVDEVKGVQLAWIYGGTRQEMVGVGLGFINSAHKMTGLQYGFVNLADDMTGVQLGFVNVSDKMTGVQIGLVNVIKTGVIPAMIFVNANF